MFCKKCHTRVIDVVGMINELKNRCKCGSRRYGLMPTGSEIAGIDNGVKLTRKIKSIRKK